MFKKIRYRILFFFLALGIIPFAVVMVLEYNNSINVLQERTLAQLKTVRETKRKTIENYFSQVRTEINFYSQTKILIEAMKEFDTAFQQMPNENPTEIEEKKLRQYYAEEVVPKLIKYSKDEVVMDNLCPKENRSIMLQAHYLTENKTPYKFTEYQKVHEKYHNVFSNFMKTYGYYDFMLVEDKTGYIVYTVKKEIDFATSLLSGAHANTHLGKLFRQIRFTGIKTQTILCDFDYYFPSNFVPAAFIVTPIFDGEKKIGTLVFQIPVNKIDAIATSNKEWKEEGYGETGECYILGSDCRMRTNSRFVLEDPDKFAEKLKSGGANPLEVNKVKELKTTVLYQTNCSKAAENALNGNAGAQKVKDYRGENVLSSYAPLKIGDVNWAILAEIDEREAFEPVNAFGLRSFFVVSILTLAIILVAFLLANALSKPILELVKTTKEIGNGDLSVRSKVQTNDEIGGLAESFNQMVSALEQQRKELFEKQDEISAQMEEITSQHDDILKKNELLEAQKIQITQQTENLNKLNENISKINESLEQKVKERTLALEKQNEKLLEYAHLNSHKLRSPVATIMGLIKLIHLIDDPIELRKCVDLLDVSIKNLDETVHFIQDTIDKAEYLGEVS